MSNFININNTAPNFTVPMPFQHFTGDYATATALTPNPTAASADACHIACMNNQNCEFFKFTPPSTCQLLNSSGTNIISGIKIDTSRRTLGMSNTYSTRIPATTVLSTSNQGSSEACESTCNLNASCFVYGYNLSSGQCTLYSLTNNTGNVGSSRDLLFDMIKASGLSITQNLRKLVFKGTITGGKGTETLNIINTNGNTQVASGSVSDFTGATGITSAIDFTTAGNYNFTLNVLGVNIAVFPVYTYSLPSITLSSASATSVSITVQGTSSLPGSSTTIDIFMGTTKYGSCTQTQFAAGFTLSGLTGITSGNVQVKATNDSAIVSGTRSVTVVGNVLASGGTITYLDAPTNKVVLHTFTTSGTFTTTSALTGVDILIVAGGGAGGGGTSSSTFSGGGGAGGLIYLQNQSVSAGTKTVTVGAGGAGSSTGKGANGGNSVFDTNTAIGGGAGGGGSSANGNNGGSGGGSISYTTTTKGLGTVGQGNDGSPAIMSPLSGGGGGGAGSSASGTGGSGMSININGTSVIYSVGGGGGNTSAAGTPYSTTPGSGGSGIRLTTTATVGNSGRAGIVYIKYTLV